MHGNKTHLHDFRHPAIPCGPHEGGKKIQHAKRFISALGKSYQDGPGHVFQGLQALSRQGRQSETEGLLQEMVLSEKCTRAAVVYIHLNPCAGERMSRQWMLKLGTWKEEFGPIINSLVFQ
jgi:hypothetical protein